MIRLLYPFMYAGHRPARQARPAPGAKRKGPDAAAPPDAYDALAAGLKAAAQAMAPGEDIQIWTKCDCCSRRVRMRETRGWLDTPYTLCSKCHKAKSRQLAALRRGEGRA